jgi:hypothetical protein
MFVFNDATAVPARFAPGSNERLPARVSLLIILVFAALSWGMVVGIVMTARTALAALL